MFAKSDGRAGADAQAAVRAMNAGMLLLSPRGGVSRDDRLVLTLAPAGERALLQSVHHRHAGLPFQLRKARE